MRNKWAIFQTVFGQAGVEGADGVTVRVGVAEAVPCDQRECRRENFEGRIEKDEG
jgi:hypothetical protein